MNQADNISVQSHNYALYSQLLEGCFDKIRKSLPKKNKQLKDLCGEAIDQVKADDNDQVLSANKYFRIMKLALDAKIPRLTEQILYYIHKMVSHQFLDGNHPDDCFYPEDMKPECNGMLPRRLIDAIIDEVCNCTTERDQQVQLQVVRALLTLVATSTTEVHERSLLKVVSSLYYIHIAGTNQINQNTAKATLIQIISIVFKKLEQHSGEFSESFKRLENDPFASADSIRRTEMSDGQDSRKGSMMRSQGVSKHSEEMKKEDSQSTGQIEDTQVTFTPEEQYAKVTMNLILDSVCLHAAKVQAIQQNFEYQARAVKHDHKALEELYRQALKDKEAVPLYVVPPRKKGDKPQSEEKDEVVPKLFNEVGNPSGKFGWCMACRNSANVYCKHTRHPVCSYECKQRHIRLLEEAQASRDKAFVSTVSISGAAFDEPYQRDALMVFKKLCQLLQSKEVTGKLDNVYDVRKVLLGLELLHSCIENPGPTFINRTEFVTTIRDSLCHTLLTFAASSEHKIFSRTVSIFYCLFLNFREHLKQTIGVVIDGYFLRMLDSGNSEYDYKYTILEFFDRLSENPEHVLEIFANYDCDIAQKDVCVKIIESLSSIAKGRFQRGEQSTGLLTPQQEASLRKQALEILVKILRNLNRTIETAAKLETLTKARLDQNRIERAVKQAESALGSRMDEDDSNSKGDQSVLNDYDGDGEIYDKLAKQQAKSTNPQGSSESPDARQQMRNRQYKAEMNKAAAKFNLKPKTGLKFLIDKGYLPSEAGEVQAKEIARFFLNTPALSPGAIGAFLGGDQALNGQVRDAYLEELNFKDKSLTFVGCQRLMLSGFRVPGESQQADRIMEAFGSKLAKDRPEEFGNSEGVYVLAYATLMLQTALHNPQAQKLRMTIDDFRKLTRGVKLNDSTSMDMEAFTKQVYEEVAREPFTLEEDEDARIKLESAAGTNKKLLFDKEREGIMRRGATQLKQNKDDRFVLIKDITTIQPMFSSTWQANLSVFDMVLEETNDQLVADLCLQGFMHAISISGYFEMADPRKAYVSSLSKFTAVNNNKEIKPKNISCIRELLNLAINNGDCLRDSWSFVLDCISRIEEMRVQGMGNKTDSELFLSRVEPEGNQRSNTVIKMKNSAIIAEQIDPHQIEAIFLNSEKLKTEGIAQFIEELCQISRVELEDQDRPRKFSLQKLVEVASLNMNRVRFQWQQIWKTLAEHFSWVGDHKNLHVVIYALDSLRQLADKFLEKEERKGFNQQKTFLEPFEKIMIKNINSPQNEIKDYVVMCMAALCHHKAKFIKSGWEVILKIFQLAATDQTNHLANQSFSSLEQVVMRNFNLLEKFFLNLIDCLSAFTRCKDQQLQVKTLRLLIICARELKSRQHMVLIDDMRESTVSALTSKVEVMGIRRTFLSSVLKNVPGSPIEPHSLIQEEQSQQIKSLKALWLPLLAIFTKMILKGQDFIKKEALNGLEHILSEHYDYFGPELWKVILGQSLWPCIEEIKEAHGNATTQEESHYWCQTLCQVLECFNRQFIDPNKRTTMQDLVTTYSDILCLFASNVHRQDLANEVMIQLRLLMQSLALTGHQQSWAELVEQINYLFQMSSPKFLSEEMHTFQTEQMNSASSKDKNRKAKPAPTKPKQSLLYQVQAQCIIQLELTKIVSDIVRDSFEHLDIEQTSSLSQCLETNFKFAKEFNHELLLRLKLWKNGFYSESNSVPGLLDQEEESLKVYLSIMFKQYFSQGKMKKMSTSLFDLCSKVLKDYMLKHSELVSIKSNYDQDQLKILMMNYKVTEDLTENDIAVLQKAELEKQIQHLSPIIHQVILENLLRLTDKDLKDNMRELGQLLIDLTLCNDYSVRSKNHKLLSRMFEFYQQSS